MTVKYTDPCWVSNQECEAPAGRGSSYGHFDYNYIHGGGAKYTCFRCGHRVCGKCSKTQDYYAYGEQRICDTCRDEIERHR